MRMIIDGSLTPLNLSSTLRASRRCETTARGYEDYSLRKMQNVRVDSTAVQIANREPLHFLFDHAVSPGDRLVRREGQRVTALTADREFAVGQRQHRAL
jgi:hypothetical protein